MNKRIVVTAILCVVLTAASLISFSKVDSYAETEYEEKVSTELITYDIWKHSNGDWQFGNEPGSNVSFDYTTSLKVDTSKKLIEVKAEFWDVPVDHIWHDMSVKESSIDSAVYRNGNVKYKVRAKLDANIKPLDIKQYDWQSDNVEGYRYYIPVKITVKYENTDETEIDTDIVPDEEDEEDSEDGNDVIYLADADLIMPDKAYAGHRVLLQDNSVFTDGVVTYSSYQFYKQGLGSSSFRKEFGEGDVSLFRPSKNSSGYYTDRYAVFSEPGMYEIKLSAKVNGGNASIDTERIEVLAVPALSVALNGMQKENRKQVLNISAALDPDKKLKKIWIEISDRNGGEIIHIDHYPGKAGEYENSELIKTRAIQTIRSDEYYENIYLEFLTKNTTEKLMKYTVHIEDEGGNTDTETGYFTVYPDDAPDAIIGIDERNIRNEGSNVSDIEISDESITYSDEVERIWMYRENGIWTEEFNRTDNSFGTGKKLIHHRNGVGKAEYMLTVKDVIPEEETLSEYITEADIKFDTAYGETEVINIAPSVSLKAEASTKADILIISDEEILDTAMNMEEELKSAFAENGIDNDIYIQRLEGNLSGKAGFGDVIETETPFSYNSQWTSYEKDNFIADSRKIYKIGADFGAYGGGEYSDEPMPKEPYIVQAYNIKTGDLVWEKRFYSDFFEQGTEFIISQDDSEDYLFISAAGKTLIVDKRMGELLDVVNIELGRNNYSERDSIYSFSERGIICINKSDGNVNIISDMPVYGDAKRLNGNISFAVCKDGVLNRAYFNLKDNSIEYQPLTGTDESYEGFSHDIYGNMAAVKKDGTVIETVKIWDSNNILIKEISAGAYEDDCIIVKDEKGRMSFVSFSYNKRKTKSDGTRKYYVSVKIESIFDDVSSSASLSSSNDYRTSPRMIYGYEESGKVVIVTAAEYWYVFNYGTSGYSERTYCYEFNIDNNTSKQYRGSGDFSWLKGVDSEYGNLTDESLILQLTEGNPIEDGLSGSISMYTNYGKDPEFLLSKYYNKYLGGSDNTFEGIFIIDKYGNIAGSDGDVSEFTFYPAEKSDKTAVFTLKNDKEISESVIEMINWIKSKQKDNIQQRIIFQKGEKIPLIGIYSDYENDPSKSSYYLYYHFPFNDGENSDVNYIADDNMNIIKTYDAEPLIEPIERFYHDGMYKIEHWQYDNTGNEFYDKKSNIAEMYFYIEGTASAPWIDNIESVPEVPQEGKSLGINIEIDDEDKNELYLETKIYLNGDLIKTDMKTEIVPDNMGNYPVSNVKISDNAASGKYSVICKVSDGTATSAKEYSFTIASELSVKGNVDHTDQWDRNRKKYNLHIFGNEFNYPSELKTYVLQSKPRKRGTNVFWSEEKFMLFAEVSGTPEKVRCTIKDTEYCTDLKLVESKDGKEVAVFTGELWDKSIKGHWGNTAPAQVTFVFTAYYEGDIEKNFEKSIIIDDTDSFWRVHKLY